MTIISEPDASSALSSACFVIMGIRPAGRMDATSANKRPTLAKEIMELGEAS